MLGYIVLLVNHFGEAPVISVNHPPVHTGKNERVCNTLKEERLIREIHSACRNKNSKKTPHHYNICVYVYSRIFSTKIQLRPRRKFNTLWSDYLMNSSLTWALADVFSIREMHIIIFCSCQLDRWIHVHVAVCMFAMSFMGHKTLLINIYNKIILCENLELYMHYRFFQL